MGGPQSDGRTDVILLCRVMALKAPLKYKCYLGERTQIHAEDTLAESDLSQERIQRAPNEYEIRQVRLH